MDRRFSNVTAIGLLVLVAGALFFWGLYYLLGNPVLSRGRTVVVALDDGAGLRRGDRVNLQGVQVGTVHAVRLQPPSRVSVQIEIDDEVRLPADTRAQIQADVFGVHMIDLVPGTALVALEDGDTIRGAATPALPDLVTELSGAAQAVLTSADSLLSPEAVANVHAVAAVLPASAVELQGALAELHRATSSLRRSAQALEGAEAGEALGRTLVQLEQGSQAFTAAAVAMESSLVRLGSVLGKIDRGDGTLGRLVNDSTLYIDLRLAVREVGALAADIRARPDRYVTIDVF